MWLTTEMFCTVVASNTLGLAFERSAARLLDVYEHFYADSVFGAAGSALDTNYVVLGYHLRLPAAVTLVPPAEQHDRYRW